MSHELCHIQFKMEQRGTSTSYAVHRRSNSDVPLGGHRSLTLPAQHSAATGRNVTSESHNLIPTGSLESLRTRDAGESSLVSDRFSFDDTSEELQKENSHFYVCEAVLATVEQMKCKQTLARLEYLWNTTNLTPDEKISNSKELLSTPIDMTPTKSRYFSTSPLPIPNSLDSDTSCLYTSSSSIGPNMLDESFTSEGSLATDETSSYSDYGGSSAIDKVMSDPETQTLRAGSLSPTEESPLSDLSAESVAISLLTRFSKSRLPTTSDFHWLVSESDVNQSLLPLPGSWPVAPDEIYLEGVRRRIRLRGNFDWAPPRPQLVFHLHPPPNLKKQLEIQNYKCAGCGMKLEKAYLRRIRYCEYLGRYFCLCCHKGGDSMAIIPSHVIYKWDFKLYSVSDFARKFLDQQFKSPVYDLRALNPDLYKTVRAIRRIAELRKRLGFVWDYIRFCRTAKEVITQEGKLIEMFETLPCHLLDQIHIFSMDDFCQIRTGVLHKLLQSRMDYGIKHITNCELCRAKGFFCEICNSPDILFPFQTAAIKRCDECGDCFHLKCIIKRPCPRCERIRKRRELINAKSNSLDDEPTISNSQT